MRARSWLLSKRVSLREVEVPDQRLQDRLNTVGRSLRRRLSDRVEALFQEACLSGDFDMAHSLLAILDDMEKRPVDRPGGERRAQQSMLPRLQAELVRHQAVAATQAAESA